MKLKVSTTEFERCSPFIGAITCPNCNEYFYVRIPDKGDTEKCIHCGTEIEFVDEE